MPGYLLTFAIISLLSLFNVNPYWLLIAFLPAAILGGYPTAVITFCCFVTDVTDDKTRAWNLACLEASIFLGFLAGTFAGPIVFNGFSYVGVFLFSALLTLFSLFHVFFYIRETVKDIEKV